MGFILQEVLMSVTNAETQILEKILIYLRDLQFIGENNLKKLIGLSLTRDGFQASLCRTSWPATFGRPSGPLSLSLSLSLSVRAREGVDEIGRAHV